MRSPRSPAVLAWLLAITSCRGDETGPETAADIGVTSGSAQSAAVGQSLAEPIVVHVTGSSGDPIEGATVTFAASDEGSASPAQTTTDASGDAQTVWTLGSGVTTQTLTVTADGIEVEVTAEAYDGCDARAREEFVVGQTISGTLRPLACELGGGVVGDVYTLDVSSPGAITIQMTTSSNDAFLYFGPADDTNTIYAFDDDALGLSNSEMRVLVPAGSYLVYASHFPNSTLGAYELDSFIGGGDSDLCPANLWIVSGASTEQEILESDCEFDDGSRFDLFSVVLSAGATLTADQMSDEVDPILRLFDGSGTLVQTEDGGGEGNDARLVYTAAGLEFPFIGAGAATPEGRGIHTFSVLVEPEAGLRMPGPGVRLPTHLFTEKGAGRR